MTTHIATERLALPMARLGGPSRLPRFRWQQPIPNRPTPPNFGLSEEEAAHGFTWGEDSILPYEVYDDYDRDLAPGTLDVVTIDNGRLRVVVAPSLGGRVLELKDLASGRDLVFRNPVFQPANLAALNAWFSGGIEWNGLVPGHSPFTTAPVFAGLRQTRRGPILRLYEFDRRVEASWQLDLFLPADTATLFAHGRLVNPSAESRLAYWWTNIAAPMDARTRVLSPAAYSVEHIWPGNNLGRCTFPHEGWDASYPDNWQNATAVFFRAPDAARRFVLAVNGDGDGLVQTATPEMVGRKFFYFGSAVGGQNWMDYLARPGEGRYLEIQSGLTPTQNQHFVLAAGEERDWTEAFAPIHLDPARAHDPDYAAATAHAATALDTLVPAAELAEIDAFLRHEARQPLDTRLSAGAPWGRRHERLIGRPLAAGLDFAVDAPADFWDALAAGGPLGAAELATLPDGIAVSPLWVARLEASAKAEGMSWLHALLLATAALDREERDAARALVDRSLALRPNWAAHRLAALLAADVDAASQSYGRAWATGDAPPELAIEIAQHFMANRRSAALKRFVEALPEALRDKERIVIARAVVAADDGDAGTLETLLFARPFATIREGETLLSDLWVRLRHLRLRDALGRDPTPEESAADLDAHPLPRALDLRMHGLKREA